VNRGRYHEKSMHFGDSIFIFILALVLFGPKKLPEIGRQVGKLLAEFRRASNEFKFQIQEEIRNMEDEERRKKLEESRAAAAAAAAAQAAAPAAETAGSGEIPPPVATAPTIMPPSMGETVSTGRLFAAPAGVPETMPVSPALALNSAEIIEEPAASGKPAAAPDGEPEMNGTHHAGEIPESVHHD
jgi:sec-independent protein translocase protein TatB